ncbi:MAG: N-acetylmuramoyl-L-alanine amidase [Lachnospiraceae bacterium]|nr:N-acetylmuramoyl-L-alanine amidase [Lachnospiraceae bacterium]
MAKEKPADPTTARQEDTTASNKEQGGSKVEAIPGQHRNPNSAVVVIDPGHQRKGDSTKEPNGPGSSTMKARVTYGTTGVATGVTEYVLNLDISMKLKTELQNRGYTVYMTRTGHDVNISNKERAEYGNSVGADAVIRIHANSSDNSSVRGAETLSPSSSNPYVSHLASASQKLGKCVINAYCKATGFKNRGMKTNDTMTGINWSEIPVTIIELGFMSNGEEDKAMQDSNMQNNMVQGIANGMDAYFGF